MGDYQQGLCKKVKHIIPGLVLYELLAGLSISISYNVMRVGLGLVILFGSGMLAAGEITLFKFLIFLYAAVRIYEPLTSACEHLGDFIASLVGAGRVSALLTKPEQGGSEDIIVDRFDIRFDHVRFAYNHEEVLRDVSFTAKQGEITALVGPSGSGKSTYIDQQIIARSERQPEGRFFILVPDQFTMQTQKEIVMLHPNHGVMNIDIVSFERLAYRVFEELAIENLAVLDDMGKSMVLRASGEICTCLEGIWTRRALSARSNRCCLSFSSTASRRKSWRR